MVHQKMAVESGSFPLFRYNPMVPKGENPFKLDSKAPSIKLEEFIYSETRYKMLTKNKPENAKALLELAEKDVKAKWFLYETLAKANQL
jgi:pyruvate-ferredoxin/flavodoxin oxidoreductase